MLKAGQYMRHYKSNQKSNYVSAFGVKNHKDKISKV